MKFLPIVFAVFAAGVFAQNGCGFPDGPDCVSLGDGANGLEQFADDGCCLLPLRCGVEADVLCERVSVGSANNNNAGGRGGRKNNNN